MAAPQEFPSTTPREPLVTVPAPCPVALTGLITTRFPFPQCLLPSHQTVTAMESGLVLFPASPCLRTWDSVGQVIGAQNMQLFNPAPCLPLLHRFGGAKGRVGPGPAEGGWDLEAELSLFPHRALLLS